jgi:excisionase family DNA binding protein
MSEQATLFETAPVLSVADGLKTPGEMAAIYKVQKSTFLQWFHAGRIPAEVAVGKVMRFNPERVAKALAKQARAVQKLNGLNGLNGPNGKGATP